MRPLTWALKEVDPVVLLRQSGISGNLGIVKIIRYIRSDMYTASNAPHKQKSIVD